MIADNATVTAHQSLREGLCILRVRLDRPGFTFAPGQHVLVGTYERDHTGHRAFKERPYSIASAPGEPELEFYVAAAEPQTGIVREWPGLGGRLRIGDHASGSFTLGGVPNDAHLVGLATGTGLAPLVSMLRAHERPGRWASFTVVHGARRQSDLGYRTLLSERARRDHSLVYVPVLSQPDPAWTGARRYVQDVLPQLQLDPARTHLLLCGNPAMVKHVEAQLAPRGFHHHRGDRAGNLHFDKYWE